MRRLSFSQLTGRLDLLILIDEDLMKLHDTDNANEFETRKACQDWINNRVVRFKLRMTRMRLPVSTDPTGDAFEYVPRKTDGKIIDKTADGFKPSGTDEPLKNYAEPVQNGGVWVAVMRVR